MTGPEDAAPEAALERCARAIQNVYAIGHRTWAECDEMIRAILREHGAFRAPPTNSAPASTGLVDGTAETVQPEALEDAVESLLDALSQMQCGCSVKERISGHLTDCGWPAVVDACDEVRAALAPQPTLRAAEPSRTGET